ncbi:MULTISPECIES: hypothetical protein [Bacillus cereus group]|uniref:Uncharacterized protein n=1 Tax=Bacillus cytotoxicus (strain DSM 22905 / CIP 110041 / 391-98 / NVH 391-98) TaxID=315749 RepID=A7GRY2_BACCN|nr:MULTISPECIES: hypothetical protein [Bacillus cereus group]ABS22890.1 conserved hypothetical protein [Bacillus cytotoxicus NVH 391-98]AWC29545.1 hypothetical protein CG483_015210 [Bacillus cytotoxicus]AWC41676.1 hypothetical protein CG480_015210 [Bacillus cytotoxicus]AWC45520.1 hypothetical protein CG479_014160 [Bacillus cytotoxicus]AWC49607.1 hypothetical protein CG478_015210 [Bacillus cytotoxicus]
MHSIQDALYNWLTIKTVVEARPDDIAAQETYELFHNIVYEDYQLKNVKVEKREEMYIVTYEKEQEMGYVRFLLESIDCFIDQIK